MKDACQHVDVALIERVEIVSQQRFGDQIAVSGD